MQTKANLPPIARNVLAQMRRYSNELGETIISAQRLAKILSTSKSWAHFGILELRAAGLIKYQPSKKLKDLMCWKLI